MGDIRISPPFEGQQFTSHQQWVNKASSWLTSHAEYRNTEHGEIKGWRGSHFTAMCFDSLGRRCRNGADMRRADEEGAFPVWWIWPDQICEIVIRGRSSDQQPAQQAQYTPGVRAFAAIDAERRRQTASEGWTPSHDDEHRDGSLAVAAACYALNTTDDSDGPEVRFIAADLWPWADEWWKPTSKKRDLEKAGALIAAEWERLDRLDSTRTADGGDQP